MLSSGVKLLMEKAAPVLAGRDVIIRWEKPLDPGANGSFRKVLNRAVIHIDPDLDLAEAYKVFLHECSHARMHYNQIFDIDELMKLVRMDSVEKKGREALMEQQARSKTLEWQAWAAVEAPGSIPERLVAFQWWKD